MATVAPPNSPMPHMDGFAASPHMLTRPKLHRIEDLFTRSAINTPVSSPRLLSSPVLQSSPVFRSPKPTPWPSPKNFSDYFSRPVRGGLKRTRPQFEIQPSSSSSSDDDEDVEMDNVSDVKQGLRCVASQTSSQQKGDDSHLDPVRPSPARVHFDDTVTDSDSTRRNSRDEPERGRSRVRGVRGSSAIRSRSKRAGYGRSREFNIRSPLIGAGFGMASFGILHDV